MWSSPGTWIIWTNTNTLIISIKILKFSKGSTHYNWVNESYLIDFPLRWQEMLSPSTGPRSQWCPPDLSAMLSSSKILHFYTVFLLWGGIWLTIIKHTFVLKSLLEEHVFDRKVNNCWLRAGSGKPDSLSVPVVSSSPHSCTMVTGIGHRNSILLHTSVLFLSESQHTRLPQCLLSAKVCRSCFAYAYLLTKSCPFNKSPPVSIPCNLLWDYRHSSFTTYERNWRSHVQSCYWALAQGAFSLLTVFEVRWLTHSVWQDCIISTEQYFGCKCQAKGRG